MKNAAFKKIYSTRELGLVCINHTNRESRNGLCTLLLKRDGPVVVFTLSIIIYVASRVGQLLASRKLQAPELLVPATSDPSNCHLYDGGANGSDC